MSEWVVGKVVEGLNMDKKSINGSKILILGIAYKKNVDDMREYPSVAIMEMLRDRGAEVGYNDPHVPVFPEMREHSFDLTKKSLPKYDCVVLTTDHDNVTMI